MQSLRCHVLPLRRLQQLFTPSRIARQACAAQGCAGGLRATTRSGPGQVAAATDAASATRWNTRKYRVVPMAYMLPQSRQCVQAHCSGTQAVLRLRAWAWLQQQLAFPRAPTQRKREAQYPVRMRTAEPADGCPPQWSTSMFAQHPTLRASAPANSMKRRIWRNNTPPKRLPTLLATSAGRRCWREKRPGFLVLTRK